MVLRLPRHELPPDLVTRLVRLSELPGTPTYAYARISQDREGAGLGVERQLGAQCELYERLRLRLVGVFVDNDISAYSGKRRPDYRELLDGLTAGTAKAVTVWHTDRLHRSVRELLDYIVISEQHEILTHTVRAGELNLSTPTGRAVAITQTAWARQESEHKGDRIRAHRLEAAENGRWHGGRRPFGFEADGITHRAEEAAEIVKATDAILAGASLRSAVRDLNQRGFRTTFDKAEWSPLAFKDVLLRPRNAGLRQHRGHVIGKAAWPPIVPEDRWRALVAVLTDPTRRTSPGTRVRWLGSGLYVCGTCGRPDMWASRRGGARKPAYRCKSTQRVHTDSPHVSRDAALLDDFVERLIVRRLQRSDAVDLLDVADDGLDTDAARSELVAVQQRLEQLAGMFAAGEVTGSQLKAGSATLKARQRQLETQLAAAAAVDPLIGVAGATDVTAVWFGTRPDRSDGLDIGRRRTILDKLFTVTVLPRAKGRRARAALFDPAEVRIDWKTPPPNDFAAS